jgi:predicted nucleotidyltransferase component of viral defense system
VQRGMQPFAIEKDAWVTLVLRMLFDSELDPHIVFKGGTSLSKVYGLIERFSEDVDLSINREYLGFGGELTKGLIRKLRRRAHDFSLNELPAILNREFVNYGVDENLFKITVPNTQISDQDPEVVHVEYTSVFEEETYLINRVLIEIGARSLNEPFEERPVGSIIDTVFESAGFTEKPFQIKTILPEKTFLEKLILLHEEFQKPDDKVRHFRMSRHLYDIYQIARTEYGVRALKNKELFRTICNHRAFFSPVNPVDYDALSIKALEFIPPEKFIKQYEDDYNEMQNTMIYGDYIPFKEIINQLRQII